MFCSQFSSFSALSSFDAKKTKVVKIIRIDSKNILYGSDVNKNIKIKNKVDLNNTWYLKTAKIEKECTINLIKDIFDGCTYLFPLIHGILTSLSINFLTVPEKFPQRFFFDDMIAISYFVKQE